MIRLALVSLLILLTTGLSWAAWTWWPPLIFYRIARTDAQTQELLSRYLDGRQPLGALKGLRHRAESSFQRTFATPLKRLPEFVGALIPADAPIRTATGIVENVVFEAKHLESLLVAHGLPTSNGVEWTIAADNFEESVTLLEALLGDWLDFYFAPEPKHILLYADHDEYTTVFATRKGPLSQIAKRMSALGVREIADYRRTLRGSGAT